MRGNLGDVDGPRSSTRLRCMDSDHYNENAREQQDTGAMPSQSRKVRAIKSWSTRDHLAAEVDRIALKLGDQWHFTLDRSKLFNCFVGALVKAEPELERSKDKVFDEASLEAAIFDAIHRSLHR